MPRRGPEPGRKADPARHDSREAHARVDPKLRLSPAKRQLLTASAGWEPVSYPFVITTESRCVWHARRFAACMAGMQRSCLISAATGLFSRRPPECYLPYGGWLLLTALTVEF